MNGHDDVDGQRLLGRRSVAAHFVVWQSLRQFALQRLCLLSFLRLPSEAAFEDEDAVEAAVEDEDAVEDAAGEDAVEDAAGEVAVGLQLQFGAGDVFLESFLGDGHVVQPHPLVAGAMLH